MRATAVEGDAIRGAAVIVDDRIDQPDAGLQAILDQLRSSDVPTVELRALPTLGSLRHWKQFGLIVLDWELANATSDEEDSIAGVAVPTGLADEQRDRITAFIGALLTETSLPIFVASNFSVDEIENHLRAELAAPASVIDQRVKVYAKSELQLSLFGTIENWLSSRPSLLALRAWKHAYIDAEISTFHHFISSEEDWVEAVHRAANTDQVKVGDALRELISRNILNRIDALDLQLSAPGDGPMQDAASLRHVMHLGAVIPASALVRSDLATGDLFVAADAPAPYEEIRILITPECDLIRQARPRFTYLAAKRYNDTAKRSSKNRVEAIRKPPKGSILSSLLTPSGQEYEIKLKAWESEWVTLAAPGSASVDEDQPAITSAANDAWEGFRRIGRLMEPYISDIQLQFAMEAIRKGLPRIPDDFFQGWAETN